MGDSRDAKDPRDTMRAMRKEARAEFEREEQNATGGQEHASREDREGLPAERRPAEAAADEVSRSTREQSDDEALRVPRGDPTTGGGGNAAGGGELPVAGEPSGE